MEVWIALVGGIIIGWVIEWVLDWLFWRKDVEATFSAEAQVRRELESARREIVTLRTQQSANTDAAGQLQQTQQELAVARQELADLQNREPDAELQEKLQSAEDELAEVQASLAAAAIAAASAPEPENGELREQLEKAEAEVADLQVKLDAALAAAAAVAAPAPQAGKQRDNLEEIIGIGSVYEQRLFDAGIETYADLAASSLDRLAEIIQPSAWQVVDYASWIEQARAFAEVVVVDLLPYRLEEIKGIGPVYVRKLNSAGIITFEDLAKTGANALKEIIQPKRWQAIDFAAWIAQAKEFNAIIQGDRPPHPLEKIVGVGPVFATKLDAAGVKTYADLAAQSPEAIAAIIGRKNWQAMNLEGWIEQASRMSDDASAPVTESEEEA